MNKKMRVEDVKPVRSYIIPGSSWVEASGNNQDGKPFHEEYFEGPDKAIDFVEREAKKYYKKEPK